MRFSRHFVGTWALVRREPHGMSNIFNAKKEGIVGVCYLRFRNSFIPSISVTYSNPFSIRLVASLMSLAVLQWYSSPSMFSNRCM